VTRHIIQESSAMTQSGYIEVWQWSEYY